MANIKALVVAGGGGGGGGGVNVGGGGAGAGGLLYEAIKSITSSSYSIVVGAGGTGGAKNSNGTQGGNSSFDDMVSVGGGSGSFADGGNGGSGGGCSGSTRTPGSGTVGQGYGGGYGVGTFGVNNCSGGGGGGSGSIGGNASSITVPGNGGTGTSNDINGSAYNYASGGQGGSYNLTTGGSAGVNYGDGGQGAKGVTGQIGGNGKDGIVIIAYKTDGSDGITTSSTGGTITTSGDYTIHTFTSDGTFTPNYFDISEQVTGSRNMDETSGTLIEDGVGSNDATAYNSLAISTGIINNCRQKTASSQYFAMGTNPFYNKSKFSVRYMFVPTATGDQSIYCTSSIGLSGSLLFSVNNVQVFTSAGNKQIAFTPTLNEVNEVIISIESGVSLKLYLNKVLIDTVTIPTYTMNKTGHRRLERTDGLTDVANGTKIDEIVMFDNYIVTQDDVDSIYGLQYPFEAITKNTGAFLLMMM